MSIIWDIIIKVENENFRSLQNNKIVIVSKLNIQIYSVVSQSKSSSFSIASSFVFLMIWSLWWGVA